MAQRKWFTGSYIDCAATSDGWAAVVIDGMTITAYRSTAAVPGGAVVWSLTASEPITDVRCACRTDTNEIRAVALGARTRTVRYFTSTTETSLLGFVGKRAAVLTRESTDWVAYIVRTPTTYARWVNPTGGASTTSAVGITGGSVQGIRFISGVTPQWAQSSTTPTELASTTLGGVRFYNYMTVSGKTVGQSEGLPAVQPQIIGYDGTTKSTLFAVEGFDPHIASIPNSQFVVVARTKAIDLNGTQAAALYVVPPWPAYDATKQETPEGIKIPQEHPWTAGGNLTDVAMGYQMQLTQRATSAIHLDSIKVAPSGGSGGGGGGTNAPSDAEYLVASASVGLPNARTPQNTDSIAWDMNTAGKFKARYVGPTIRGPKGDPGPAGPPGPPGSGSGSALTVAALLALGYWTLVTNGDPVSPEVVFDSNGDVVPTFVPTP